jgi:hypothetical protein
MRVFAFVTISGIKTLSCHGTVPTYDTSDIDYRVTLPTRPFLKSFNDNINDFERDVITCYQQLSYLL